MQYEGDVLYYVKIFLLGMFVMFSYLSAFLLGRIAENNFREFAKNVCGNETVWYDNIYSVTYIKPANFTNLFNISRDINRDMND